jgi:hypothetical protein
MIDVADFEWTVAVAGSALFECPEKRLYLICRAAALPFLKLLDTGAFMDGGGKCLHARRRNLWRSAKLIHSAQVN